MREVTVLGAGLAGSECAWQLARRGIKVKLWEMKPEKMSPAHTSPYFGELVCSNSLRSDELSNAVGLLKAEMRSLGSLIMDSADKHRVAAGGALAVDREGFARTATCISMTPWPPSSPWRAWIWTAPFSPPATVRAARIM